MLATSRRARSWCGGTTSTTRSPEFSKLSWWAPDKVEEVLARVSGPGHRQVYSLSQESMLSQSAWRWLRFKFLICPFFKSLTSFRWFYAGWAKISSEMLHIETFASVASLTIRGQIIQITTATLDRWTESRLKWVLQLWSEFWVSKVTL